MNLTSEERALIEAEIRQKIREENRLKKAEWRKSHRENIRKSNEKYYRKLKEMRILAQASEILAQRKKEELELQTLAHELAAKVPEMKGEVDHD